MWIVEYRTPVPIEATKLFDWEQYGIEYSTKQWAEIIRDYLIARGLIARRRWHG